MWTLKRTSPFTVWDSPFQQTEKYTTFYFMKTQGWKLASVTCK